MRNEISHTRNDLVYGV